VSSNGSHSSGLELLKYKINRDLRTDPVSPAIPILLLASASAPSRRSKEFYEEHLAPTGSSSRIVGVPNDSLDVTEILRAIDTFVADTTNFEEDEQPPSSQVVRQLKELVKEAATQGAFLPHPEITTFYGELAATWKGSGRTLRLAAFSDHREPLIYFLEDQSEPLPRGQTIRPATATSLVERLRWVFKTAYAAS
jgi:hypothetical protein